MSAPRTSNEHARRQKNPGSARTHSSALPTLRRLLAPPRHPIGRRDALSPASLVLRWWGESDEAGRRDIQDAVVAMLQELLRSRTPLAEPHQSRLLLQLAQLVAELRLDERARALLWSAAQHGRISTDLAPLLAAEVEARLLGWMAVIQVPEWLPTWLGLWRRQHKDLWAVSYAAIMNTSPMEAASLLPEILDRRQEVSLDACADLIHSLLQETMDWAEVTQGWREQGRRPSAVAADVEAVLDEVLEGGLAEPSARGLAELKEAANASQANDSTPPWHREENRERVRNYLVRVYDGVSPPPPLPILAGPLLQSEVEEAVATGA